MQACSGGRAGASALALAMPALLQHAPLRCSLLVDARRLHNLLQTAKTWDEPCYLPAYALPPGCPAQLQQRTDPWNLGPSAFFKFERGIKGICTVPRRVLVCSVARGALEGKDEAAQHGRGPLVARLLEGVTPLTADTTWLLLRVLLDEQVLY